MTMNVVKSLILFVAIVIAILNSASCKQGGKVASLAITPANTSMALWTKQQFNAITTLDDGSVFTFTPVVEWNSTNQAIASVDNVPGTKGIVEALSYGTTTITATDTVNKISASIELTVTDPQSITITPANPHMAIGTVHQFLATANFPDTTTQGITLYTTWTIPDPAIATITTNTPGLIGSGRVTAVAAGITSIEASFASVLTSTTKLTVTADAISSITVTVPSLILSASTNTVQFTAIGNYPVTAVTPTADFTSSVNWRSSNTSIATVDSTGLVTRETTTGKTIITATDPITNHSGSETITVE
jgi:trimeric autotransporter adhesin